MQTELVPNQSGFLRRTTARGGNGDWLVMVLWRDHADAAAFASAAEGHPAHVAFMDLVDATSLRRRTYTTLD